MELLVSSAILIQMLLSPPDFIPRGLDGIRRCFPWYTTKQVSENVPANLPDASSILGKKDLCTGLSKVLIGV